MLLCLSFVALTKKHGMGYVVDISKMGLIFGEVIGILEHEELKRPEKRSKKPSDYPVKLAGVTFGYHDKEVLYGINMEMPQGTVNVIVGPSGSGK